MYMNKIIFSLIFIAFETLSNCAQINQRTHFQIVPNEKSISFEQFFINTVRLLLQEKSTSSQFIRKSVTEPIRGKMREIRAEARWMRRKIRWENEENEWKDVFPAMQTPRPKVTLHLVKYYAYYTHVYKLHINFCLYNIWKKQK